MADAEFVIRNEDGVIVLDFADRITRLTLSMDFLVGDTSKSISSTGYDPIVIQIGPASERDNFWFLIRYSKTFDPMYPANELGPGASWSFSLNVLADLATYPVGHYGTTGWERAAAKMDNDHTYIVIRDLRDTFDWQAGFTYNEITLEVGKF